MIYLAYFLSLYVWVHLHMFYYIEYVYTDRTICDIEMMCHV